MSECYWMSFVVGGVVGVAAWFLGRHSGLKEGIWLMEPLVKARFAQLNAGEGGDD